MVIIGTLDLDLSKVDAGALEDTGVIGGFLARVGQSPYWADRGRKAQDFTAVPGYDKTITRVWVTPQLCSGTITSSRPCRHPSTQTGLSKLSSTSRKQRAGLNPSGSWSNIPSS